MSESSAAPRGFERADLSEDQVKVYDAVLAWVRARGQTLSFGGLAGTGKTTVVAALAGELLRGGRCVVFAAFTGKAVSVLRRKLAAAGLPGAECRTLHSLLYVPVEDEKTGRVKGWAKRPRLVTGEDENERPVELVVVDEASMVGRDLWEDLRRHGVPVLAVGDHGQLPPVGDSAVNLVANPELRLERIHRQAEGNPILALAHGIRHGESLEDIPSGDGRLRSLSTEDEILEAVSRAAVAAAPNLDAAVLCYTNRQRVGLNAEVRRLREFSAGEGAARPRKGDVVICLRNSAEAGVFNGMRGILESCGADVDACGKALASVRFPDDGDYPFAGLVNLHQFGRDRTVASYDDLDPALDRGVASRLAELRAGSPRAGRFGVLAGDGAARRPAAWYEVGFLFDYAYAMTVHKAQGSQFSDVILFPDGRFGDDDFRRRWLYTAVTRASERLCVVGL